MWQLGDKTCINRSLFALRGIACSNTRLLLAEEAERGLVESDHDHLGHFVRATVMLKSCKREAVRFGVDRRVILGQA